MSEAAWWVHLRGDPSGFVLDDAEPGLIWRALLELLDRPEDSPAVERARLAARSRGMAAAILERQDPLGFWGSPSAYGVRWGGTAWQLMAAAALGADPEDPRLLRGANVLLEVVQPTSGGFAIGKGRQPASCFTAELCATLARLGFAHHPRVREAVAWLSTRPGAEGWACPELRHLVARGCPVAAVAVLRLVAEHPPRERPALRPLVERAAAFLLRHELFTGEGAPRGWLRFAHPNLGRSDLLDALWALARSGVTGGAGVAAGVRLVLARQGEGGRWLQGERVAFGEPRGQPSRWVTAKALVVLAAFGGAAKEG